MNDEREPLAGDVLPADGRPFRQPAVCVGMVVIVGPLNEDVEGTPAIVTRVHGDSISCSPVEEDAKNFRSLDGPVHHVSDPRATSLMDQNPDALFWAHNPFDQMVLTFLVDNGLAWGVVEKALKRQRTRAAEARKAKPTARPVTKPEPHLAGAGAGI